MPRVKLTKTIVAGAQPGETDIELRDTLVPGFFCKITPTGRKVFMLQYRTNSGKRRKPSLGLFGELTVEQARTLAQDLLADVRRGNDPSGQKARDRQAPIYANALWKITVYRTTNHLPKRKTSTISINIFSPPWAP